MEKKRLMQFEFQTKNGEVYWLPLFLKEQSAGELVKTELAITQSLSKRFKKVKRYSLSSENQSIHHTEILNGYIQDKMKGAWVCFIPAKKKSNLVKLDGSFHFTTDITLKEEHSSRLIVSKAIVDEAFPVRCITPEQHFDTFEDYLVVKLNNEKIPAYLPPGELNAFNRTTGFLVGMIAAMILVLTAFNWTSVSYLAPYDPAEYAGEEIIEEMIPITVRKKELPPPPKEGTIINKVENRTEPIPEPEPVPEPKHTSTEGSDKADKPDVEFPVEIIDDNTFFAIVEDMPVFQGCEHLLTKKERTDCTQERIIQKIGENFIYPSEAMGAEGKIFVSFIVEKNGKVGEVELLKGIYGARVLGEEAIRVVQLLPDFTPGKQRGKPVRVKYNVPIKIETN